jgi:hypothetical protein
MHSRRGFCAATVQQRAKVRDGIMLERTVVVTAFPYPLIWGEGRVDVRVEDKLFSVYFKRHYRAEDDNVPIPTQGWSPGITETTNIEIPHDRWARVAYTVVRITFPTIVDIDNFKEIAKWAHSENIRLLEVYRFTMEEFHTDTVPVIAPIPHATEGIRYFPPVGGAQLARIARMPNEAKDFLKEGTPLPVPKTLLLNARREELLENYRLAVVEAETAFETLVDQTLTEYYRSQGATDVEIDNKLQAGLKNLVKDHLPRCCGGQPFIGTAEHSAWENDLYKKRNDVVHNGAFADAGETRKALDAAEKALQWIASHKTT